MALGWPNNATLFVTLATIMEKGIYDERFDLYGSILHHEEGVDLAPSSINLSCMDMHLVNAMRREFPLREYLDRNILAGIKRSV